MGFEFTDSQRAAIYSRGGSVLVSAAAGSGKTRVLTERVLSYVTDENDPQDIDRFLIITYTRAAAAELRGRITGLLAEKAAANPFDRRMRRQQEKCAGASIGTIHSFCAQVLRENCHALGLSPSFSVLDEAKCAELKAAALEKVLEARYEGVEKRPDFRLLSDTVGVGRDDRRLEQTVLSLHTKLMSHPYPEDWAARQAAALSADYSDAGETVWGEELLRETLDSAEYWLGRMDWAVNEISNAGGKLEKAYFQSFSETTEALRGFVGALEAGWDAACEKCAIPFPRIGVVREPEDPELVLSLKAIRDACKKAAAGWAQTFGEDSESLLADLRTMSPAMCELLSLSLDMERAYSAEKRRRDALDFSDLEHLTLELLIDRKSGEPTEAAKRLSERYTEIMVDEYQDVNSVQEMIFRAVSKNGQNLFMVGDVKQSIYRFRLADPTIFMGKYRAFAAGEEAGRLILLRENFRSRKCVLDAANSVFSRLMTEKLGEIDYDENASLVFGAKGYPEGTDTPAELRFIDTAGTAEEDSPEGAHAEALYIAGRMKQLYSGGEPVYENGTARPCRWSDFALLLHSPGVNGEEFAKTLAEQGIPVSSGAGGGFFDLPETALVISLLEVLDDPWADVPLISVLRSPVFGFSPDELADIRTESRDVCFYDALKLHAEGGSEKCARFLALVSRIRSIAPELSMDALLWRIYSETGIFAACAAMDADGDSHARLMQLMECARDFAGGGAFGLARFVKWLRGMAERGETPGAESGGDCVKIMSIHKSKGLEFPFVFLADLSHGFNRQDVYAPVIMHSELGLGPKLTDAGRGLEYPTIARRAVAARLLREKLSEEMRVLYVAMTRAKERLIMTCIWDNAEERLCELAPLYAEGAHPELLLGASSFAKWLAAAAILDKSATIDARAVSAGADEREMPDSAAEPEQSAEPDNRALEELKSALAWRYPYEYAVDLPTKLTATGLERAGLSGDEAAALPGAADEKPREFRRPRLGGERAKSAAERGTAMHAALQYADFSRLSDANALSSEKQRLVSLGRITAEQAAELDVEMLLRFGKSPLCRRIIAADEVRREFRFTLLVGSDGYFEAAGEETLLLQGVVDCFIVENGEITVIDYKTDRVPENAEEYSARYFPQLRAYASALERICKMPVREALLHFLRSGQTVSVPLNADR